VIVTIIQPSISVSIVQQSSIMSLSVAGQNAIEVLNVAMIKGAKGDTGPAGATEKLGLATYTRTAGKISRIDWDNGDYKSITYDINGAITQIDYHVGAKHIRTIITRTSVKITAINKIEVV